MGGDERSILATPWNWKEPGQPWRGSIRAIDFFLTPLFIVPIQSFHPMLLSMVLPKHSLARSKVFPVFQNRRSISVNALKGST
jgi:hypothetical protein